MMYPVKMCDDGKNPNHSAKFMANKTLYFIWLVNLCFYRISIIFINSLADSLLKRVSVQSLWTLGARSIGHWSPRPSRMGVWERFYVATWCFVIYRWVLQSVSLPWLIYALGYWLIYGLSPHGVIMFVPCLVGSGSSECGLRCTLVYYTLIAAAHPVTLLCFLFSPCRWVQISLYSPLWFVFCLFVHDQYTLLWLVGVYHVTAIG